MEPTNHNVVFYDGSCGLCHASVKFILKHDAVGKFHYAPVDGEYFRKIFVNQHIPVEKETVIVYTGIGTPHYRTDALVYILHELGGGWATLGTLIAIFPRPLRDLGYALVARTRRWFFKAPAGVCPVVSPELATRFYS